MDGPHTAAPVPVSGARLEALVSSMARYLGSTLSLKDPEVNEDASAPLVNAKGAPVKVKKLSFGKLMYEQLRYLRRRTWTSSRSSSAPGRLPSTASSSRRR